jgi:hypothetical protein
MQARQAPPPLRDTTLSEQHLGPLPLINHFLQRLRITEHLETTIPSGNRRVRIPFARTLTALLRILLHDREPLYAQAHQATTLHPQALGLTPRELTQLSDDAIGNALDELFTSDHETLLTSVIIDMARTFNVRLDELHADTTTITLSGQYPQQREPTSGAQPRAPFITRGFNKDHRPDLKQLLVKLTTSSDGDIPIQYRVEDGNQNDSNTHEATWVTLRAVTGTPNFLYVADSKLCNRSVMDTIDRAGGRFITVMPRNRSEDRDFRKNIASDPPTWVLERDQPNPNDPSGPRDQWFTHRPKLPSSEGWPITWVQHPPETQTRATATRAHHPRHPRTQRPATQTRGTQTTP